MRHWLVLLAMVPGVAHADREPRVLALDDALALARAHNRDLRAAHERLAESAQNVDLARAALLPTVAAQGKYTRNYKEVDVDFGRFLAPTSGLANVIATSSSDPALAGAAGAFAQQLQQMTSAIPIATIQKLDQLDFSLTATAPLVAPAALASWSAAKHAHRADAASFDVTLASVLVAVAQTYFAAAGADELVTARRHAVAVAKETFENAKARVEAEVANQVDVTRAEASLVRAEQDHVEAENVRATAYRALATLLGAREPFVVQPASGPRAAPAAGPDAVAGALRERPELASQRESIAAAAANTRAAAWRWSPTLSAFGNVRAFNYAGFSGDKYAWAIGLELDWVLYDGGARDAQRRLYAAQRREAEARLELETDTVRDEIDNAVGTLDTKQRAVLSAQRAFDLATESLRLVRAQYEAGAVKQLDVLQAQDSLVLAEVQLAQSHFDVALADLQLRRATGEFPGRSAR